MQYVSRHSSAARRSQSTMLLQPVPGFSSAVAGLPSLGGGDFVLPATYRMTRPVAVAQPPVRPARRPEEKVAGLGRALIGLGMGSTIGLTVGAVICAAIVG